MGVAVGRRSKIYGGECREAAAQECRRESVCPEEHGDRPQEGCEMRGEMISAACVKKDQKDIRLEREENLMQKTYAME